MLLPVSPNLINQPTEGTMGWEVSSLIINMRILMTIDQQPLIKDHCALIILDKLNLCVDIVCLYFNKKDKLISLAHYHFVNESLNWYEAQSFCRLKYNDLATINNMNDENHWIGLYNGQYKRWLWSDGSGRLFISKNKDKKKSLVDL
uniref:C-type lectin domain-containing protein n=1 Tax=Astatotilapia calliptera TaxID=8154 RepID=A0A3P8R1I0_ASTCA